MADTPHDRLKLQLSSLDKDVNADAFLEVFRSTLDALKAIDKTESRYGSETVEWLVVDAGHSSPLFAMIQGVPLSPGNGRDSSQVVEAFVNGLKHLELEGTCPRGFDEVALKSAGRIVRSFARGVASVDFQVNSETVSVTRKVSEHASQALRKLEHEKAKKSGKYVDYGTIEGTLKDLSQQSQRDKIVIVDDLTGMETTCYVQAAKLDAIEREAWKHRVAVTGDITIDRYTREPIQVDVFDIRILRDRSELPGLDDLKDIDITDGVESAEYVRNLRDAEST